MFALDELKRLEGSDLLAKVLVGAKRGDHVVREAISEIEDLRKTVIGLRSQTARMMDDDQ